MGKITFRRVVHVAHTYYGVVSLPVLGSVLFFLGSFTFLPGGLVIPGWFDASVRSQQLFGATSFLLGSVCFFVAPLLDFLELQFNLENLAEHPGLPPDEHLESERKAARYEYLYKATLLQVQRANTLLYMLAGVCFVVGSCMFYANRNSTVWYTHGDWLYIAGCLLSGMGALVGLLTAVQLRQTAQQKEEQLYCWRVSDEAATISSCTLYLIGNGVFIVGALLFFPQVLEAAARFSVGLDNTMSDGAVGFFAIGSILFLCGALIDLGVVVRTGIRKTNESVHHGASCSTDGFVYSEHAVEEIMANSTGAAGYGTM